jgi:hypothetical protein
MSVRAEQLYSGLFQEIDPTKRQAPFAEATAHTEVLLKTHPLREIVDNLPGIRSLYRANNEWESKYWPLISADKNCNLLLVAAGCEQLPSPHAERARYGATQTASWRIEGGVNHNVQVDIVRETTHYDNFSLATLPKWLVALQFPEANSPFIALRETSFPARSELQIGYGDDLKPAHAGQEIAVNSILRWLTVAEKSDVTTDIDVFAIK